MDKQILIETILAEDIKNWSRLSKASLLHTLSEHRLDKLGSCDTHELIVIRNEQRSSK